MQNAPFEIVPMNPVIGAEIHGLDLSKPLGERTVAGIKQALLDHQVIFFRGQELDPDSHMRLAGIFGELEPPHPIFPKIESHPQIAVLENDENRPPETNIWHTDVTWRDKPPLGSVLYGAEIPASGGDTMWASMTALYEALSPSMQKMLEGLRAVHSIAVFANSGNYETSQDAEKMMEVLKLYPPQSHPVIRTHPETGKKALFVNATFTTHIEGLPLDESAAILRFLAEKVKTPEFQVRFKWEKGSVAIWDNRATQHYAVADYYPQYRRMHRITINGDVPY
ncbi:taurine dioxygenase [Tepidicaulis sp.]|uniref:taurine dioxygenase n=1 Tax=Tepidicaulis sp. TaxID=1920809 RepID=UPI003B599AC9